MRHQPQTNPAIPIDRPKWDSPGFPSWSRRRAVENVLFALVCVWLFTSTLRDSHQARHRDHATQHQDR